MDLITMARNALLKWSFRNVTSWISYTATASLILCLAAIALHLQPQVGSPTWWCLVGFGVIGLPIPTVNWSRHSVNASMPIVLLFWLLTTLILICNPDRSEVGMVLIVGMAYTAAFYQGWFVMVYLALIFGALLAHVAMGGPPGITMFVAITVLTTTGCLRVMTVALKHQARRAETFERLTQLLPVLKAQGIEEVVRAGVRQLVKATGSRSGIVAILDEEHQTLSPYFLHFEVAALPGEEEAWRQVEIPMGRGLAGWVAQHRRALITGDAEGDPRAYHVPGTDRVDESLIVVPLMAHGKLYGTLRLQRSGLHQYADEDLALVELMATHVSDALSRAALEEQMSRTDALTGVYNRHYLNEWMQLLEPSDREISLLMADCREFKKINDQFGHLAGDRILIEAARLIRESVRSIDLVVRYGGDEFLVVLRGTGAEGASHIAQRLADQIVLWNAAQPEGSPVFDLDIGVETALESELHGLMERADARMYASKRASLQQRLLFPS